MIKDEAGNIWTADMDDKNAMWNVDEYGDRSFMWDYR